MSANRAVIQIESLNKRGTEELASDVEEEGEDGKRKSKKSRVTIENGQETAVDEDEALASLAAVDEDEETVISLFDAWIQYIEAYENDSPLNIFRPELYGVLWCGQGVQKREGVSDELYHGMQSLVKQKRSFPKLYEGLESYIEKALDAKTLSDMDRAIYAGPADEALRNKHLFLQSILASFVENIYSQTMSMTHSEISWNEAILWPVLKACISFIRRELGEIITFAPGEEPLNAMAEIGVSTIKAPYLADAVLRARRLDNLEICLLETSRALGAAGQPKVSYDHHKGMFGLLSMLKHVANTVPLSSYEKLSEMKFVFLHGHGDSVRVWNLSTPYPGVFLMCKELKFAVPKNFEKKSKELLPFLESCWHLAQLLISSFRALDSLHKSHDEVVKEWRFKSTPYPLQQRLSHLVHPVIVKMSEKQHASIVSCDGPMSSPLGPSMSDLESDGSDVDV